MEQTTRLYHCHKIHKNVTIFEDYEIIQGVRTLVRCSCPHYIYKDTKPHCDGNNDFGFRCGYAEYSKQD